MIEGVWAYIGTSWAAFLVCFATVFFCYWFDIHTDKEGKLSQERIGSIAALSLSIYTFTILAFSQITHLGPPLDVLVKAGFGNDRLAWLLVAILFTQSIRLWAAIHEGHNDRQH